MRHSYNDDLATLRSMAEQTETLGAVSAEGAAAKRPTPESFLLQSAATFKRAAQILAERIAYEQAERDTLLEQAKAFEAAAVALSTSKGEYQ